MASGALPEEGCAAEALRDADSTGPSGVHGPHGRARTDPRCTGCELRIRESVVPANRLESSGGTGTVGAPSISGAHTQELPFIRSISWVVSARGALDRRSDDESDAASGRRLGVAYKYQGTTRRGLYRRGRGEAWWSGTPDTSRAFWAALDVELAYPSVRINQLAVAMERALRRPVDLPLLFDGCPQPVLEALAVQNVRVEIGRRLTRALGEFTLDSGGIPPDSWGPPQGHPLPRVSAEPYEGIPTGLAISGVLLNVVFLEPDRVIGDYLERTLGEGRGAIVRFADDMYVLSRSSDGLLSLVEAVHGALSGAEAASLAMANGVSNICINFGKIKPDAVQDVIGKYLLENGWTPCEKCKQPLPTIPQEFPTAGVLDWWAANSSGDEFSSHREALQRAAIEQGDVGPFVTSLVERLSDMGTDTLRQRFGEGARDHLARLHELARFDIEDEQVQPDTRRTFSVNRLVRAWLPEAREVGEQHRKLRQIRETIGFVLDRTPWKFALWRAVVRGAARRPLRDPKNEGNSDQEASKWLANQLRRIACVVDQRDSAAWMIAWPEVGADDGHAAERTDGWWDLYLSFLRAAFWRSLAQVLLELKRHAARVAHEEADAWTPLPFLWTTRAVAEGDHTHVAASLGRIDQWVDVLYPAASAKDVAAWPWELDEFVGAILAAHSTSELGGGVAEHCGAGIGIAGAGDRAT